MRLKPDRRTTGHRQGKGVSPHLAKKGDGESSPSMKGIRRMRVCAPSSRRMTAIIREKKELSRGKSSTSILDRLTFAVSRGQGPGKCKAMSKVPSSTLLAEPLQRGEKL